MRTALFTQVRKSLLIGLACAVLGTGMICYASAPSHDIARPARPETSGFFSFALSAQSTMRAALMNDLQDGKTGGVVLSDGAALAKFYGDRDGQPVWVNPRGTSHERAAAILAILEESWTQALNPKNYHAAAIRDVLHAATPEAKAQLELLVSDGVLLYARDMTGMHVKASAIRQDGQSWRKPMTADAILQAAADNRGDQAFLVALAPGDKLYTKLRDELITLTKDSRNAGDGIASISFNGLILRPGDHNRGVPKLRARLGLAAKSGTEDESRYDPALAQAVMDFQHRHGLTADGHIGQKTLALLNRPTAQKISQIVANMERLRWLEQDKPERYVMVNIPAQRLWAVDHGKAVVTMPVIVGKPERPTKSFIAQISGVRFNPKWTVPPTVKTNDFLPRLIEDPTFLANKGIDVSYTAADGHREYIDSTQVDWAQLSKADLLRLHMVQSAGDDNALGKIRVLMDNPYDIYLHDTVNHALFSKPERLFSSGCIRLSDPEAVARFILTDNKGWSDQKMHAIIDSGRTTEINVAAPIPVYILYQTMWLDADDHLVYGPDVYGQDKTLVRDLTALNAYAPPTTDKAELASADKSSQLR